MSSSKEYKLSDYNNYNNDLFNEGAKDKRVKFLQDDLTEVKNEKTFENIINERLEDYAENPRDGQKQAYTFLSDLVDAFPEKAVKLFALFYKTDFYIKPEYYDLFNDVGKGGWDLQGEIIEACRNIFDQNFDIANITNKKELSAYAENVSAIICDELDRAIGRKRGMVKKGFDGFKTSIEEEIAKTASTYLKYINATSIGSIIEPRYAKGSLTSENLQEVFKDILEGKNVDGVKEGTLKNAKKAIDNFYMPGGRVNEDRVNAFVDRYNKVKANLKMVDLDTVDLNPGVKDSEITDLNVKLSDLNTEKNAKNAEIINLNKKVSDLDAEKTALQKALDEANKEVDVENAFTKEQIAVLKLMGYSTKKEDLIWLVKRYGLDDIITTIDAVIEASKKEPKELEKMEWSDFEAKYPTFSKEELDLLKKCYTSAEKCDDMINTYGIDAIKADIASLADTSDEVLGR